METTFEKTDEKNMNVFDKKITEADAAIKNGARFYTRDEADKIIDLFLKKINKEKIGYSIYNLFKFSLDFSLIK